MKNAKQSTCARSNAHGLTLAQQNAVDLLAAGKNDTETADALKLNRVTVTRWRLYSPEFRAALADQAPRSGARPPTGCGRSCRRRSTRWPTPWNKPTTTTA